MTDRCAVSRCRGDVEIVYLDHGVCTDHWNELTADSQPANALARALGIQVANIATTESDMSEQNTSVAESGAKEETVSTKKKAVAKAKTGKPSKSKAVKAQKPKKERVAKAEQPKRVFAFRCHDAELAAIHKTAGPRNATRMIRAVAAAFAAEDEGAFRAVLREATGART